MRRASLLARQLAQAARGAAGLCEASPSCTAQLGARQLSTGRAACWPTHIEDELYCRQRSVLVLGSRIPFLAPDAWVAPNAIIVGDVDLFNQVSIWYGCVLRGDLNTIKIGAFTNVQDRTVIHAARTSPTGLDAATMIGQYVSIGPNCMLRSATVQDEVWIGPRCILMEGSMVETQSMLAAGTVLPPGRLVPTGELWAGNPAKFVRKLTTDEKAGIANAAKEYIPLREAHADLFLPNSFAYTDAERIQDQVAVPGQ